MELVSAEAENSELRRVKHSCGALNTLQGAEVGGGGATCGPSW